MCNDVIQGGIAQGLYEQGSSLMKLRWCSMEFGNCLIIELW
jgi:hypothetical protein